MSNGRARILREQRKAKAEAEEQPRETAPPVWVQPAPPKAEGG